MGLEKVKQDILEKARKEADEILEAAAADARAIMKSAEKQAQDCEKALAEEEGKAAELMKRREVASAELEMQKQVLSAKNELIESVFDVVRKRLKLRSDKSREADVKSLLKAASQEMGVAVVQCNTRDAKFIEGGGLRVAGNDALLGGIIAESPDGRLRVDYSYETLLGQVKAKVLSDVAKKLFGK